MNYSMRIFGFLCQLYFVHAIVTDPVKSDVLITYKRFLIQEVNIMEEQKIVLAILESHHKCHYGLSVTVQKIMGIYNQNVLYNINQN